MELESPTVTGNQLDEIWLKCCTWLPSRLSLNVAWGEAGDTLGLTDDRAGFFSTKRLMEGVLHLLSFHTAQPPQ